MWQERWIPRGIHLVANTGISSIVIIRKKKQQQQLFFFFFKLSLEVWLEVLFFLLFFFSPFFFSYFVFPSHCYINLWLSFIQSCIPKCSTGISDVLSVTWYCRVANLFKKKKKRTKWKEKKSLKKCKSNILWYEQHKLILHRERCF